MDKKSTVSHAIASVIIVPKKITLYDIIIIFIAVLIIIVDFNNKKEWNWVKHDDLQKTNSSTVGLQKINLIESSAFNKLIEAYIVQLGPVNIVIIISSILIIIIIIIMKSLA